MKCTVIARRSRVESRVISIGRPGLVAVGPLADPALPPPVRGRDRLAPLNVSGGFDGDRPVRLSCVSR